MYLDHRRLDAGHACLTGRAGADLERVRTRPETRQIDPDRDTVDCVRLSEVLGENETDAVNVAVGIVTVKVLLRTAEDCWPSALTTVPFLIRVGIEILVRTPSEQP